jgi:hypothetical protein
MSTKTPNEEIQYLSQMVSATRKADKTRLKSLGERLIALSEEKKQ